MTSTHDYNHMRLELYVRPASRAGWQAVRLDTYRSREQTREQSEIADAPRERLLIGQLSAADFSAF
jgi:hypothetical protein